MHLVILKDILFYFYIYYIGNILIVPDIPEFTSLLRTCIIKQYFLSLYAPVSLKYMYYCICVQTYIDQMCVFDDVP